MRLGEGGRCLQPSGDAQSPPRRSEKTAAQQQHGVWGPPLHRLVYIEHIQIDKVNKLLIDQDELSVDEITREASSILISSAVATFPKSKARSRNAQKQNKNTVWFNKECRLKRQEYLKAKRLSKVHRNKDTTRSVRQKSKKGQK